MATVIAEGLTKTYGTFPALAGVSFEIARGETFALLGPNGAGKSTTIEILEGFRDRTSGSARVLGVDPQRGGLEWKARLGIVLQSSGETGTATVHEQLKHFAGFYPNPRDVDDTISAVGLESKRSAQIRSLSGGQKRRVDVALGIIGNPEVLFLDEPTTGFDPAARRQFWQLIRSLRAEGTTIVLTTHYLDEAAELSDRAGIIVGGTLIECGPIHALGSAEARTPQVRWVEAGAQREHRTDAPGQFVAALTARLGGEPEGLVVHRPSLEDIYLGLISAHDAKLGTAHDAKARAAHGATTGTAHDATTGAQHSAEVAA